MPAFDALDGVTAPAEGLIGTERGARLRQALERAAAHSPATLSAEARVALQNDVWGLWQRTRELPSSSEPAAAMERAAARLIAHLAVAAPDRWRPGLPQAVAAALGSGWTELESELPSLQHERMYGIRRVFHIARRGDDERALFSTLVALDPSGRPTITSIPGEIEWLRFEGDALVEARVFELDRRALREHGSARALMEVDEVAHIPTTGANRFYAEFDPPAALDPPAPLASPPCVRCHDDAQLMSLPTPSFELGDRYGALLQIAVVPGSDP